MKITEEKYWSEVLFMPELTCTIASISLIAPQQLQQNSVSDQEGFCDSARNHLDLPARNCHPPALLKSKQK